MNNKPKPFDNYENFEDWLDATRISLSNEIMNMTPEEEIKYLREQTSPIIKEFNIQVSNLQPVRPHKRERIAG